MTALAFIDRYKAIRQQFYKPRDPIVPVKKPNVRARFVYPFPIGPSFPFKYEAASISEGMAAAQEIIDSQKIISVPRNKGAQILKEVCEKHQVSLADVISERRHQYLVKPRQEAMYRLCTETDWSLPRIGRLLGGRDHTTILHGKKKFKQRLDAGEVTL
jgi:hypothetical protein